MPLATNYARQPRFTLPGSEKQPITETTRVSPASGLSTPEVHAMKQADAIGSVKAASGSFTVSVVVKAKERINPATLESPAGRMAHADYVRLHGPDPESMAATTAFAKEYGMKATPPTPGRRAMQVTGTVAQMQRAFGVQLKSQRIGNRSYRVREGSITLPRGLFGHVEAVLGLDNRPQATPHFRCLAPPTGAAESNTRSAVPAGTFTPVQIAELYGFPMAARADGQAIGLIELDGGFRQADLNAYFNALNLPAPKIVVVSVDGGKNAPTGNPNGPDGEVMLDIEVAAAVAPGATIVVYFAPNTDKGFVDAIATAVHDRTNKPSVISISWGSPEIRWTGQSMTVLDEACQAAAALGVTITVAAGDNGSTDDYSDGKNHADFPASSPHVLGCGGTKLVASGSEIKSEKVWNEEKSGNGATGGGVSNFFPQPVWQEGAKIPKPTVPTGGRGVPDVAADADPVTGYYVRVDGESFAIGGTSAVAPLWAGLIALCNAQNKSTVGFINPTLYATKLGGAFHDIKVGNNGGFKAGTGWDACTGLGTPIGAGIKKVLGATIKRRSRKDPKGLPRRRKVKNP
jgi:kumamolisin